MTQRLEAFKETCEKLADKKAFVSFRSMEGNKANFSVPHKTGYLGIFNTLQRIYGQENVRYYGRDGFNIAIELI